MTESGRIRYAVLTLSGAAGDGAGKLACELIEDALDAERVTLGVVPDDRGMMERVLVRMCDEELCDLVVTIGGTGVSPRDVVPEVTRALVDRELPGVPEAMRALGSRKNPLALISRAVCGLRGRAIIVNLSRGADAVRDEMEVLLPVVPRALAAARGDDRG